MLGERAKAAVFVGPNRDLEIRQYPVLEPRGTDVLLSLERSWICGTDIHILERRLPIPPVFIPGHEFIGRIVAMGPRAKVDALGNELAVGDLAIACVAQPCGKCFNCKQDETASCLGFGVTYLRDPDQPPHFHGGFAECLHHPGPNLIRIPKGIALDAAAALPCAGPTAVRAFDFAGGLVKKELVVVQGTGPVGLFAVAWAVKAGCKVIAIGSGSNRARMKLAADLGAELVLDYRKTTRDKRLALVMEMAARLGRGNGADVVFEATGAPSAIPEGLNMVRTLGRYLVPGQYSDSGTVEIQPNLITFKAVKIVGSGQYKTRDVGVYLDFLARHKDLQKAFGECITHRYPVGKANMACAGAAKGRSVKAVFVG